MHPVRPARAVAALALVTISLLALSSCGRGPSPGALVLWGDTSGPFATGTVVSIKRESELSDTYLVAVKGEREAREFTRGRIRKFAHGPRRSPSWSG